jgi:hypothetical protein
MIHGSASEMLALSSIEFEHEIRPFLPRVADCIQRAPRTIRSDLVAVAVREHGEWTIVVVPVQAAEKVVTALCAFPSKALRRLQEPTAPGGIRVVTEVIEANGRWIGVLRFLFLSAKGGVA